MVKTIFIIVMSATLWSGTVLGQTLESLKPQQRCDRARVMAWGKYLRCVDGPKYVVPPGPEGPRCRHPYFKEWSELQGRIGLATTTCIGNRFVDNGDGTITDNLTALTWEKKTNLDGTANLADPRDGDNQYPWTAGVSAADGGVFQSFLAGLNAPTCFAGQCDWRLPTIAELQTIVADFPCTATQCTCGSSPCVDPNFPDNTQSGSYWSATTLPPSRGSLAPSAAWTVDFSDGSVVEGIKFQTLYVRAVRGGW